MRNSGAGTGAVVRFALGGFAALVLVSAGVWVLLRRQASAVATDDAKRITRLVATGIVQPELDDQIVAGDKDAIGKLDRTVRTRVLSPDLVRVKVWTADGRIVYSDEPRLIGSTFELSPEQKASLKTGEAEADASDLDEQENRYERGYGTLLEVYLPVRTRSGRLLLFETYQRLAAVAAGGHKLLLAVLPLTLGALLLLWVVQLPVAFRMARRLREGQREREQLLSRALDASNVERRRIAADLHDGLIQELAGVAFALSAAGDALEDSELRGTLREGARRTREGIRSLRAKVVEIYPPNLRDAGFAEAVTDLAGALAARGIDCSVAVDDEVTLGEHEETLLFRAAQEALRNVASHSNATSARVRVTPDDGTALLTVIDDGSGFAAGRLEEAADTGHVGLRLLRDMIEHEGGSVKIESQPGKGTLVEVRVPVKP